jgi:hypothetical protein
MLILVSLQKIEFFGGKKNQISNTVVEIFFRQKYP